MLLPCRDLDLKLSNKILGLIKETAETKIIDATSLPYHVDFEEKLADIKESFKVCFVCFMSISALTDKSDFCLIHVYLFSIFHYNNLLKTS